MMLNKHKKLHLNVHLWWKMCADANISKCVKLSSKCKLYSPTIEHFTECETELFGWWDSCSFHLIFWFFACFLYFGSSVYLQQLQFTFINSHTHNKHSYIYSQYRYICNQLISFDCDIRNDNRIFWIFVYWELHWTFFYQTFMMFAYSLSLATAHRVNSQILMVVLSVPFTFIIASFWNFTHFVDHCWSFCWWWWWWWWCWWWLFLPSLRWLVYCCWFR